MENVSNGVGQGALTFWFLISIRHNVPKRSSIQSLLFLDLVLLCSFGNSSGNFLFRGVSDQSTVLPWTIVSRVLFLYLLNRYFPQFSWDSGPNGLLLCMTEPLASMDSLCLICAVLMRLWSLQSCPALSLMHSFQFYLPDVLPLHKSLRPQSSCVRFSDAHNLMQRWNTGLCLILPFVHMSPGIHEMLL